MAEKARMWAVVSDNRDTIDDRKKTKDRIKQQRKGKIQPVWLSKINVTSSVYEMKSTGPNTEPCGTLQVTGIGSDIAPFAQKVWVRSRK